jgi:hypothetical protein
VLDCLDQESSDEGQLGEEAQEPVPELDDAARSEHLDEDPSSVGQGKAMQIWRWMWQQSSFHSGSTHAGQTDAAERQMSLEVDARYQVLCL